MKRTWIVETFDTWKDMREWLTAYEESVEATRVGANRFWPLPMVVVTSQACPNAILFVAYCDYEDRWA